MRHVKIVFWSFYEIFQREFQREGVFLHKIPRSKLLDVFHVSYVTHAIQCLVTMLSVKPIVNRFYYIPGQIRESCGCPSDIDARR